MTRIKLISDIHIDSYDHLLNDPMGINFIKTIPNENVDILVVAGDIVTGGHIERYYDLFKAMSDRFEETVMILGNHDFYRHSIQEVRDIISSFCARLPSNFHWLDNTKKEIKGISFVGSTLWFPEILDMTGKLGWVDFRYVEGGCWPIFEEFRKAKQFLTDNVNARSVVVTHHMPSYQCVDEKYKGDDYNCFFVADVESIILENKPKLWLHGHGHDPLNGLRIWDTYCYRNPRAYPGENTLFDPNFLIDTKDFE
jgi:Icc-related predicted phosphoesterase